MFDELSNENNSRLRFSTYVFNDNRQFEEQVIFEPLQDSQYLWFMENNCRVAFCDETYIKPDIAGRDSSKFFPRAAYPNVVLEVVRTHIPDQRTFQKLFELSKCNNHIYFYFIAEGQNSSKINHFRLDGDVLTIRVSHYLIGGKIYRNGEEFYSQRDNESFEDWYRYLENSYFLKAKENA